MPLIVPLSLLHAQQKPQAPTQREVVVVTGVYEPVSLEEVDRPVRLFDVREQQLTSNTLVDFLRLEPSVDLRQRAPNGVQADVSLRGATFGQTLVLLNGFRLNDAQTGHHNLDVPVPLESVARVEILRGSGSTLYGSDAVGGVVHFVTQPPDATELRLRTAVGNFGVNQERGSLTFLTPKPLVQQFAFSRDFSSGFRPNRDYRNLTLSSMTDLAWSWGPTELLLAHSDRPFGADRFYGNFNSWERTRTWFAAARQGLGKNTDLTFAFRRHTDLFVLYRDRPEIFTNRHAVEGYQAAFRRRQPLLENTRLFYGLEGYHDSIASTNLGDHLRRRAAGYLALDVRAARRFSFSAGAREEFYQRARKHFSPSLSAGYWLTSNFKLRAGASHAFRLPSFTDLYYHDPAHRGSPDLRPERAWTYEAGTDWAMGDRVRGELTLFQRRERDGIDFVRQSPADVWRATNIQRLVFNGIETSVTAVLARSHQVEVRYTGLGARQGPLDGLESRYVFNYARHASVASWSATLPAGMMARTRLAVLKRFGRNPYLVWDLYLARTQDRMRPFLQLTNLTNSSYEEILGVPAPGRAVVLGIELLALSRKR